MRYGTIALLTLFLSSGCAQVASNFKAFQMTAPDVVSYSRDVQNKAAVEIQSGKCPVLSSFAADYSVMRDQSRLITKGK